jgi:2-polyprenyl-3-methyl-5-hydroxy-6-metoxy-1,4-benzoquinol methylase
MNFPAHGLNRVSYVDSGWGGLDGFLDFLHLRLRLLHRFLTPDGSLFLHLDYRVAHLARLLLEEVFGADHLINEIIWSYASGGGTTDRFGRKHDTILWFAKGHHHVFNADATRVPYRAAIAASRKDHFHEKGMICPDVWEISRGRNGDGVTGYPTEKPDALVDRIVLAASNEGDFVLDAFAGSGSLAAAAARAGRTSIAIDSSPLSLHCHRRRLSLAGVPFELHGATAPLEVTEPPKLHTETSLLGTEVTLSGAIPDLIDGWALDEVDHAEEPLNPVWLVWRQKKDRWPLLTSDPIQFQALKPFIRLTIWTLDGERVTILEEGGERLRSGSF